jgi:4-hydroxy-2-oxoheptanedioate aldolase
MGAAGVIVPCVDTVAQARSIVAAAKLPPLGNRSFGGRRVIDRQGREYADAANDDVLCVVQVESPEALANAAAIAAVPGVDALFLGPDDLLLRRGYGVNEPRNEAVLGDDLRRVVDACRQHGKYAVMVGIDPAMCELCARIGFHLIVAGGDVPFLAAGSRKASMDARSIIANISGGRL